MIVISRGLARGIRGLARRCMTGRPRGPAPPVVFDARGGTLTAWVRTDDAALAYTAPHRVGDDLIVVPMAVVEAVEGAGGEPVELAVGPKLAGEARFIDQGAPAAHPFDAILPGKQHRPPAEPDDLHAVPGGFLAALHECGRTAARDGGRFALTRVQVKGKAGQVVATDGRTALVWGGFRLPFADDLLVPAVPVFGAKEVSGEPDVRVGRTPEHLVVAAGPWRVFLPVDRVGRYPDVAGVVPREAPAVAGIDATDAVKLADALPRLPGAGAEERPVTLSLDRELVVLARNGPTGRVKQFRLGRSPAAGPPARVAVDRRVLARALALECHTVRVAVGKPVVFEGANKTLVTVALVPTLAVGVEGRGSGPSNDPTVPVRRTAVRHETNGNAQGGRPEPPAADPPDALAAAEDLRSTLADALGKAGRLVSALKSQRKEKKALTQVWAGLRQLNLGTEGRP